MWSSRNLKAAEEIHRQKIHWHESYKNQFRLGVQVSVLSITTEGAQSGSLVQALILVQTSTAALSAPCHLTFSDLL